MLRRIVDAAAGGLYSRPLRPIPRAAIPMEQPLAPVRGHDRLIVSLHIPKTGGTSFGAVLQQAYPGGVAFCYRPDNRLTHPLLRDRRRLSDPELLAELEASGIRVIHGHAPAAWFLPNISDPARYWTWLRDPVERVISAYYYLQSRTKRLAGPDGRAPRDRIRGRTLEQFAARLQHRNLQSRSLAEFDIEQMGFVGITERFEESLAILGLPPPDAERTKNVNKARPEVDPEVRALIRRVNDQDAALYERGLELHERRRGPGSALGR